MIKLPTAEPIVEDPIIAIDTTDIIITEPELITVQPVQPVLPRIKECANSCVICGICSVCILTILCFGIPI